MSKVASSTFVDVVIELNEESIKPEGAARVLIPVHRTAQEVAPFVLSVRSALFKLHPAKPGPRRAAAAWNGLP